MGKLFTRNRNVVAKGAIPLAVFTGAVALVVTLQPSSWRVLLGSHNNWHTCYACLAAGGGWYEVSPFHCAEHGEFDTEAEAEAACRQDGNRDFTINEWCTQHWYSDGAHQHQTCWGATEYENEDQTGIWESDLCAGEFDTCFIESGNGCSQECNCFVSCALNWPSGYTWHGLDECAAQCGSSGNSSGEDGGEGSGGDAERRGACCTEDRACHDDELETDCNNRWFEGKTCGDQEVADFCNDEGDGTDEPPLGACCSKNFECRDPEVEANCDFAWFENMTCDDQVVQDACTPPEDSPECGNGTVEEGEECDGGANCCMDEFRCGLTEGVCSCPNNLVADGNGGCKCASADLIKVAPRGSPGDARCVQCTKNSDCNDDNACTVDSCNADGKCRYEPQQTPDCICPESTQVLCGQGEPINPDLCDQNKVQPACTSNFPEEGYVCCAPGACDQAEDGDAICRLGGADGGTGGPSADPCANLQGCWKEICESTQAGTNSNPCEDGDNCTMDLCSGPEGQCQNIPFASCEGGVSGGSGTGGSGGSGGENQSTASQGGSSQGNSSDAGNGGDIADEDTAGDSGGTGDTGDTGDNGDTGDESSSSAGSEQSQSSSVSEQSESSQESSVSQSSLLSSSSADTSFFSSFSFALSSSQGSVEQSFHYTCQNQACVLILEPGVSTCTINEDCEVVVDASSLSSAIAESSSSTSLSLFAFSVPPPTPSPTSSEATSSEANAQSSEPEQSSSAEPQQEVSSSAQQSTTPRSSQGPNSPAPPPPTLPELISDPYCGDGTVDAGEECDDGNIVNSDGCSAICTLETPKLVAAASVCGNGSLEANEECDDSNRRDNDGCNSNCQLEIGLCGDGRVQSLLDEQCENATHDPSLPYRCEDCRFLSLSCGDGVLDPGEDCDNGTQNSTSPDASCRPDCSITRCGDGVEDSVEQCDDGNRLNGDGCDRFCFEEAEDTQVAAESAKNETVQFNANAMPNLPTTNFTNTVQQPFVPPAQFPLAQLQPLIAGTAPVGDTGPAAVAVIGAGAAAGFGWMRRRK